MTHGGRLIEACYTRGSCPPLGVTELVYTSGSPNKGEPMTEREMARNAARRLAIIRHAQGVNRQPSPGPAQD